ncbi:hypothetical protein NDU88_008074 [Pleurodeles waltl]|uniref:Uncharacterized protein n=1 Tax=Pleurodeles waltl TaxID=8319 RepID=A0AAV7N5A4_PLEWA|nr:hypothetical protein NDU88_008074 [Pleurodeles waltl]
MRSAGRLFFYMNLDLARCGNEDQYCSLSDEEELEERGPGGKCLGKRKHLGEGDLERECTLIKKKSHAGVPSDTKERQVNPAKEMTGESSRQSKEYFYEFDEYILDISEDNDLDEFDILEQKGTEKLRQVKDPLGQTLFEPSDVKHPRSAEWWPMRHVAEYLKQKVWKPLERSERNVHAR